jgi:hypothetical protein
LKADREAANLLQERFAVAFDPKTANNVETAKPEKASR